MPVITQIVSLLTPITETISMASKTLPAYIQEHCSADIEIDKRVYPGVKLHAFPDFCADIILGRDWLAKHESVTIHYKGKISPVKICNLTTLDVIHPHHCFNTYRKNVS